MTAKKIFTTPSRKLIYDFVVNANCEMLLMEVRLPNLSANVIEANLRSLAADGSLLRRQIRLYAGSRVLWVYRGPEAEINPDFIAANESSVALKRKERADKADKPKLPCFKKIMEEEPSNYKILRDLPTGSEQMVDELFLSGYYDTDSPNYLKDFRPMKEMLTADASCNIVQIIRDASELQKVTANSPPNWTAINSLAQSILISSASLMRDSLSNIWGEHDRK